MHLRIAAVSDHFQIEEKCVKQQYLHGSEVQEADKLTRHQNFQFHAFGTHPASCVIQLFRMCFRHLLEAQLDSNKITQGFSIVNCLNLYTT